MEVGSEADTPFVYGRTDTSLWNSSTDCWSADPWWGAPDPRSFPQLRSYCSTCYGGTIPLFLWPSCGGNKSVVPAREICTTEENLAFAKWALFAARWHLG